MLNAFLILLQKKTAGRELFIHNIKKLLDGMNCTFRFTYLKLLEIDVCKTNTTYVAINTRNGLFVGNKSILIMLNTII